MCGRRMTRTQTKKSAAPSFFMREFRILFPTLLPSEKGFRLPGQPGCVGGPGGVRLASFVSNAYRQTSSLKEEQYRDRRQFQKTLPRHEESRAPAKER